MNWYAVRTIFHFGVKDDGKNVFEERIVVFEAENSEDAFSKAEIEAIEYSKNVNRDDFEVYSDMDLYKQDGEKLIDGYEVWSQLFETTKDLNEFYQDRYIKYDYNPED